MTDQNRDPNVDRVQLTCLLNHKTDAEGHDDLRDDRDVERALGVSRPLQSTCVSERDSDEESRDTEYPQKLDPDLDDGRVMHAKDCEQLSRQEQEKEPDERRAGEPKARCHVHRRVGPIGTTRTEVLTRDSRSRAH